MERAWQRLVDEIEALRVAFVWQGRDRPVQRPSARAALPFAVPVKSARVRILEFCAALD